MLKWNRLQLAAVKLYLRVLPTASIKPVSPAAVGDTAPFFVTQPKDRGHEVNLHRPFVGSLTYARARFADAL